MTDITGSMLQRFLVFWLALLSALAYFWRDFNSGFDPFTASAPILSYLIALIMFVIGCLLPPEELKQVWRHWPTVLMGTILQYTVMPLLAFACGQLLFDDQVSRTGLIMVGCVPGAMASNVLTLMARGNVSYSVSLTTCATLLSPFVVPLALLLFLGSKLSPDPLVVFVDLMLTVVGPVLLGFTLCRFSRHLTLWMKRWGSTLANLVILWLIAVIVGLNRGNLGKATLLSIGALLLINVLGYLAGYLGGLVLRMPEDKRRALTLEIGMQNAGLGAALSREFFKSQPAIALLPALYTFGCMLTGTLLARVWATIPLEEKKPPPIAQ